MPTTIKLRNVKYNTGTKVNDQYVYKDIPAIGVIQNGGTGSGTGEKGGYYLPSVNTSGDLTWTYKDSTVTPPAVSGVNIKGTPGADGGYYEPSYDRDDQALVFTYKTTSTTSNPTNSISISISELLGNIGTGTTLASADDLPF